MKKIFAIIFAVIAITALTSCEGYTWKYKTTITYHYAGEKETHVVTDEEIFSFNEIIREIGVRAYANSFNCAHEVVLIYEVSLYGRGWQRSYSKEIMNVPDKAVIIDEVKTKMVSKTKTK